MAITREINKGRTIKESTMLLKVIKFANHHTWRIKVQQTIFKDLQISTKVQEGGHVTFPKEDQPQAQNIDIQG